MQKHLELDAGSADNAPTPGPELVVGMITPLGIDGAALDADLRASLARWNYVAHVIRLSDLLQHAQAAPEQSEPEYSDDRIERLINAGDAFCTAAADPAAVARLGIRQIKALRKSVARATDLPPDTPLVRTAYIIHSLKRAAEVDLFRKVYGDRFFLVARHAPFEKRRAFLVQRWGAKPSSTPDELSRRAKQLMDMDANEEDEHGQGVDAALPAADYYLGADESPDRAVDLLFGDHRRAPTADEHAMFTAYAASSLSLEGSRRVGAVLVAPSGSIIALGANQVPPGELSDAERGYDWSDHEKREILTDTLRILAAEGWLLDQRANLLNGRDLPSVRSAMSRATDVSGAGHTDAESELSRLVARAASVLTQRRSRLFDLIEFQRPVHAEMSAITDAARRGVAVEGATLFTTTYPCHLCVKHVFSSGIDRVYFIAPYPKSRATAMYAASESAVRPFHGTGPQAYRRLFLDRELPMPDSVGHIASPDMLTAVPRLSAVQDVSRDISYLDREDEVSSLLEEAIGEPGASGWRLQPLDEHHEDEGSRRRSSRAAIREAQRGLSSSAQVDDDLLILCEEINKGEQGKMSLSEYLHLRRHFSESRPAAARSARPLTMKEVLDELARFRST